VAHHRSRGLELPAHKDVASAAPIVTAPAPAVAVIALDQGSGRAARVVVAPGDRVRMGTRIAVATDGATTSVHAPIAGRVLAIESRPTPSGDGPCILIENDGSEVREHEARPLAWAGLEPAALAAALDDAGVAGCGGAAFPAATKLAAALRHGARHLVLNGAECEPWICCDDALMRARANDVVLGIQVLMHAMGAERCTVAIEDDKPEAMSTLQAAVAAARDARIEITGVASCYPAGAERTLLEAVTGIEVPHGAWPPESGLLCHNVGTAAAAAAVVRGEPVTSRIVTVTGSGVLRPGNVDARLGTPVSKLVEACGGYTDRPLRLIAGGSMMGRALATDEVPVTLALNCVLVATAGDLVERGREVACIRCGDCADVCPPRLLPQQLLRGVIANDQDTLERHGLADCIECGCCDYVCPSAIPLTTRFRAARAAARVRESARRRADDLRERHARHGTRLEAASEAERRAFETARDRARSGGG
jgi:electron transport complex protein RnfC